MVRYISIIALILFCSSCGRNKPSRDRETIDSILSNVNPIAELSSTANRLDSIGLVNVGQIDNRILVDIVYATPHNFVGQVLYEDLTEAYLLPEAAQKVIEAQNRLEELHPGYRLIIYDAARPMSVQKKMWEIAVKTGKQYYVANPANGGGLHNYGAAVDISIIDSEGKELPMGTAFDFFGPEANIDKENELVRNGKITQQELENRLLLRKVMTGAGFTTVKSEWWHFNLCSRKEAMNKYQLLDL